MVISGQCVFDYSGCHNKVQSTGRLTQKKCVYLLVVLEAGSLRSGCQHGLSFLLTHLFIVCLHAHMSFPWFLHMGEGRGWEGEREGSLPLLIRPSSPV